MLEQHEDQAQSTKSSSSAESKAEMKRRVEPELCEPGFNFWLNPASCHSVWLHLLVLVIGRITGHCTTIEACLDWSRREDIQTRTVKGRLSWTGRRYLAGTPNLKPASWYRDGIEQGNKLSANQLEDQLRNQLAQDQFCGELNGCSAGHLSGTCAWLQPVFQEPGASRLIAVDSSIRSTTRLEAPSSDCTRSPDEISTIGFSSKN
ncbi:hypothetical protein F511_42102 [Dorcoceras hygrometricum]|uniref:Uncharacterized protein n=1 Tax=Dorcoceras hygrometricum TaxID=472368 RepID=A0A2Z6ZZE7_9LAMI|nr:hypothetical protein F511_42102 [Dorcoceras hygrometricum]